MAGDHGGPGRRRVRDDRSGTRIDNAVGAISSSLGVLPFALPLDARFAAATFRAIAERTPEEGRAKLARGERMLAAIAEQEAFGRSWVSHALGGAVALGTALVLSVGFDRPASGVVSGVTGLALTEAQIFTQPIHAIEDWDAYRRAAATATPPPPRAQPTLAWSACATGGALGITGRF